MATVAIDDEVFTIPPSYRTVDDLSASLWWPEDEQDMSSLQGGAASICMSFLPFFIPLLSLDGKLFFVDHPSMQQQEEMLLQLAIQESFRQNSSQGGFDASQSGYVPISKHMREFFH